MVPSGCRWARRFADDDELHDRRIRPPLIGVDGCVLLIAQFESLSRQRPEVDQDVVSFGRTTSSVDTGIGAGSSPPSVPMTVIGVTRTGTKPLLASALLAGEFGGADSSVVSCTASVSVRVLQALRIRRRYQRA